jgi:hypothetical protein
VVVGPLGHGLPDGGDFHEIGAGTDDVQQSH